VQTQCPICEKKHWDPLSSFPSPFLSSVPFPSSPPNLFLEVVPLNAASESGERYKLPSGVWDGAPAEIESAAHLL